MTLNFKRHSLLRMLPWLVLPAITVAVLNAAPNGEPTKLLQRVRGTDAGGAVRTDSPVWRLQLGVWRLEVGS